MKQTSITKLSEVYNNLKDLYDGKQICHDYKSLADLIKDVIRAEASTPVKGSKFDIYKYVGKDQMRPIMTGIFHEEGWRVACDLHIMYAEKAEYPQEYERKILGKDGAFIEGKYPQWRSIIPKEEDGYVAYEFDVQKFYDWLEARRVQWKTETGKSKKFGELWRVKVGPAFLKAEYFDKVIAAMKEIGTTKLYVKDGRRAVFAKTDKGFVLLMPVECGNDYALVLA